MGDRVEQQKDPSYVMPFRRWEHQWLRAWRWYDRTVEASGRDSGRGSLDAEDFGEALAQALWHLKDWLKNDENLSKELRGSVEGFVGGEQTLLVLADLCNGSKHAVLTTRVRARGTKFGTLSWMGSGDVDDPETIERVRFSATAPGWSESREVMDIAHEGLVIWEEWLTGNGLLVPRSSGS